MRAVGDETLNAYVDGELSSQEAAALARRAALDPAIAARIALLHQLRAGVAALADTLAPGEPPEVAPPLPESAPDSPARGLAWLRSGRALAAVVAVLALAAGWLGGISSGGPAGEALVSRPVMPEHPFVVGHDAWSQALERSAGMPVAPEWLAGVMQATGLRLVHAAPAPVPAPAPAPADGAPVMHYAFVGSNDCRLSLFEQPLPGEVDMALHVVVADDLLTARWQMRGFGYTVIARAMDRDRFTTIAAAVLDVTRARQPAGEAILASLRAARQRCAV